MHSVGNLNSDIADPRTADVAAASNREFSNRGTLRYSGDHKRIRADDHRSAQIANRDVGALRPGQAFAANLKFPARNRGDWCYFRNQWLLIAVFSLCHEPFPRI